MSRPFFGFLLLLSIFMLVLGATSLDKSKPAVLVLWLIIGGFSVYKLFDGGAAEAD
ncbi:MAG TPA: hypothetical protein VGB73_07010 [Pyrinomonadaceae bacterium]|jgi:hypothetical protein